MRLNEKVYLEDHNDGWQDDFINEVRKCKEKPSLSTLCYEHIGSTSIPSIKAKPIVDIMVGVEKYPSDEAVIEELEECGYRWMKEMSVSDRLYFIKRGLKNFNIHVIAYKSTIWKNNLSFRNYLLTHPEDAQRYSCLKEKIVSNGTETLLEYSKQKAAFIEELYRKIESEAG